MPLLLAASGEKRGDNSCPQWGATTVASTMKIAHLAGISTFVTGGIGGVHRSGEVTMDVSADLTELASTPVVVVSAGIKSILDIQRTLEVLETNSVPTYGWQTDDFPAFFSPKSGVACPKRVDSPQQIANAYWACRSLQLSQGMLLAVPNHDPAGQNVEDAIQSALQEAADLNILGQDVTPFVLKKVAEQTQGESLKSNIALVKRNAEIGANIAIAIASAATTNNNKLTATKSIHNPVQQIRSASGSQHNVGILRRSHELRMSPMSPNQPMRSEILNHANILVMDGGTEVVKRLDTAKEAAKKGVDICFIPSGVKCAIEAFRQSKFLPCVKYAIVDVEELLAIADGWTDSREDIEFALRESDLQSIKAGAKNTLAKMHETEAHVLITLEDKGLLLASRYGHHKITFSDFPRKNGIEFYKGTAASDSLCGAFLHELLMGRDTLTAATEGFHAVETLLTSGQSIYPLLSQYEATC